MSVTTTVLGQADRQSRPKPLVRITSKSRAGKEKEHQLRRTGKQNHTTEIFPDYITPRGNGHLQAVGDFLTTGHQLADCSPDVKPAKY